MAVAAVRVSADHAGITTGLGTAWIGWPNDVTVWEQRDRLQVRISHGALAEMRAEARRGARLRGDRIETGGMLIGAIDEAIGCVFIDAATGPPPDSRLSEMHFEHGIIGAQEIIDHHNKRSHKASGFVGMWHTHPQGEAAPSPTDQAGMANLVTPVTGGPTQALMVILAGPEPIWTGWRDTIRGHDIVPRVFAQLVRRADRKAAPPVPLPPAGIYFPGGLGLPRPSDQRPARRSWWWHLFRREGVR
jgi:integrative and conjugative element protein (TIGR02256 family)